MSTKTYRGHVVLAAPTDDLTAITKPFRPGAEDYMLFRVINDCVVGRVPFVLVEERAPLECGGWIGISVWRLTPRAKAKAGRVRRVAP